MEPNFAPNTVNHTVEANGKTWLGQPGQGWTLQSGGGGTGGSLNQLSTLPGQLRTQDQSFLAGQNQQNQDFSNRYAGAINNQPTMSAMAERFGNEAGLPQLRANAQGLQNTMFQLPQTYQGATRGYDVNSNQLQRIIGQKQYELAPSAEMAQQNLGNAENVVNTRLGYGAAEQQKQLLPYQSEQQMMQERQAREATMYSQDNQRELDALIAKINTGVQLSEGEANRANTLSIAEKGYQSAQSVAQLQNQRLRRIGTNEAGYIDAFGNIITVGNQSGSTTQIGGATGSRRVPANTRPPLSSFNQ